MRSRLLLNLALLVLAAALGLYLFWVPPAPAVAPPLPDLDAATLTVLSIDTDDGSVELERAGTGWRIVAPYSAAADATAVERILSRLPPPVYRRYAEDEMDLALAGLAPAQLRLTLDGTTTLAFGSRAPLDGYRYLRVDGAIYLSEDAVYYLLSGGVSSLVDKHPVPTGASIDRIELPTITLTRTELGWDRDPDDGALSDADQTLADLWTSSQAIDVTPAPMSPPLELQRIGIGTDDGWFRELWVDPAEDSLDLYDLDGGLVYEMPGGLRSALLGQDREPAPAAPADEDQGTPDPGGG
jgi:uncharacterized protein DUF4340